MEFTRVSKAAVRLYCLIRGLKRGIAALCLGGGEAVGMAVELMAS